MGSNVELNPGNTCANLEVKHVSLAEPFGEMYELQRTLQARMNCLPQKYDSPQAAAQKIIYWEHCVGDEILEMLEWLDQEATPAARKELQMEAIDIVHFVFNIGVELNMTREDLIGFERAYDWCDLLVPPVEETSRVLYKEIINLIRLLPWKQWKTYPELSFDSVKASVRPQYCTVFQATLDLCMAAGLTRDGVVDMYFAKNKENHRRQDNGY